MAKEKYSCLAIFHNEKYVKYAKLLKNQNNVLQVKDHGIKFVKDTVKDTIYEIILDTNSKDVPVVLNSNNTKYFEFQIFKQISNSDLNNAIKLEFEDWCENNSVSTSEYSYVNYISDIAVGDYKKGVLAINSLEEINNYLKIGDVNVAAVVPASLTTSLTVSKENRNYILFDLDDLLTISVVFNGKVIEMQKFDEGMQTVFERFEDVLGSYQKAYDSCKQINVFTEDEESHNKIQIEEILEPILQEILAKAMPIINANKNDINKIILTGSGTLFTNMDTLITEYYGIRCDILKPAISTDRNDINDISELIQVSPAIALGIQYTNNLAKNVNYIVNSKKEKKHKSLVSKKAKKDKKDKKTFKFEFDNSLPDKINKILIYPIIVSFVFLIGYVTYSNIYINNTNDMINTYNDKINEYETETISINADITKINTSKSSYSDINENVSDLITQIEENEIGKFTTYNVASFMQKIITIIPVGVQISEISSDDNKNITIIASASNYSTIGYFVANLRLNTDIIKNVSINEVTNGSTVIVEIGGELP